VGHLVHHTQADRRAAGDDRCSPHELTAGNLVGVEQLGELAARQLYALRNIKVGKVPPEIAGNDMDGTAFKLSDYRGKVILLDFWGFW
jgi:hypothetical protein